ncbi:MAG: hypothetical protein LW809_04110 [Vampirovibrionales bacterium]|jgi:hypothetical protein|nr:hypothetical protein [Vampirovibrionales bacterium]
MKPLNEKEFEKLVKRYGCRIQPTSKHYEILGPDDVKVMVFAVSHAKGAKRYVKVFYVKQFLKMTETHGYEIK